MIMIQDHDSNGYCCGRDIKFKMTTLYHDKVSTSIKLLSREPNKR